MRHNKNMKHIKKKKIIAMLGAAVISLSLFSGCTAVKGLFNEIPASEVQGWKTSEAITITEDMLGLDKMDKVLTENGSTLYIHPVTTEIAIETKDGEVWYSNPQNRLKLNQTYLGRYSSPLLLSTIDTADTSKTMNAFDDSVKFGQFEISKIDKGVRVEYRLGQVSKTPLYPQVFTKERFEEVTSKLSQAEIKNMTRYYLSVNYDTINDSQTKKNLEEQYSKIAEVKEIYTLKQSLSTLESNRITEYLNKVEYTEKDRASDQERVGYNDKDKARGNLVLPVEYTLLGGKLEVNIPAKEIRTTANLILDNVTVLPYFNTESGLTSSKGVIPDGSGGIIDLGKIQSVETPDYDEKIYGRDYAMFQSTQTSYRKNIYFPLYGIMTEKSAVAVIAEGAQATSSITAGIRANEEERSFIGFKFRLLDYSKVKMSASDTETINSYPEKTIDDDIKLSFNFLEKGKTNWFDIADYYRNKLKSENKIKQNTIEKVPIMTNLIGAIDDKKPVFGIPTEVIIPTTTFKQAEEIISDMSQAFPQNLLEVSYSGWSKGGVKSSVMSKYKPESSLGGKKGFKTLLDHAKELKVNLYPEADVQYVYRESTFDGFSKNNDVARFITREAAYKPQYNYANFTPDKDMLYGFVIKPTEIGDVINSFKKSVDGVGFAGFKIPYVASDLSGDFTSKSFITRNEAEQLISENLKSFSSNYAITSKGANAYTLEYLTSVSDIPFESNTHMIFTETIPFTQMVLSGSIPYFATEINTAADERYYLLKCLETGSAVNLSAIGADNSVVKDTSYSMLYSVNYQLIKKRSFALISEVTEGLKPFYGKEMISHEQLESGVVKVIYQGGTGIIVNYNNKEVQTENGTVPAAGWIHVKA